MPNTFGADAEPPVDLSALREQGPGPAAGTARWEALAARVERAAAPELARRAARRGGAESGASDGLVLDLVPLLARALRPALLAAAAALFVVGAGLARSNAPATPAAADADDLSAGQLVSEAQVAQALRVGDAGATWLAEGTAPTPEALARAIGLAPADPVGASGGAVETSP